MASISGVHWVEKKDRQSRSQGKGKEIFNLEANDDTTVDNNNNNSNHEKVEKEVEQEQQQ